MQIDSEVNPDCAFCEKRSMKFSTMNLKKISRIVLEIYFDNLSQIVYSIIICNGVYVLHTLCYAIRVHRGPIGRNLNKRINIYFQFNKIDW